MDHEGGVTVCTHYEEISWFHVVRTTALSTYANILSLSGQKGRRLVSNDSSKWNGDMDRIFKASECVFEEQA